MNEQELIERLRSSGKGTLRPERVGEIKQTLMAELDRVTSSAAPRAEPVSRFMLSFTLRPMIAVTVAALVLVLGFGTTAFANAAKPGDLLFGWDTAAEQVRHALTVGERAKASYEASVAEERLREELELESVQSEYADEAAARSAQALEQALTTVTRVKARLEEKDVRGADALRKVEIRLRALRSDRGNRLKIEMETEGGVTKVHVEFGRSRWEWRSLSTTTDALVDEIVAKTGLPVDDVRALVSNVDSAEGEDDGSENDRQLDRNVNGNSNSDEDSSSDKNSTKNANKNSSDNTNRADDREDDNVSDENANRNVNKNTNRPDDEDRSNENTNTNDGDEDERGTSVRVRVDLDEGATEIRTSTNGGEKEWELETTSQAEIIASISAKTGLSSAAITAIWDFQQR